MIQLVLLIYCLVPALFSGLYLFGYVEHARELVEPYNISIITGAAAYTFFMAQFIWSARLRFVERTIPQDKMIALHATAGTATLALMIIHGTIKFLMVVLFQGLDLQIVLGIAILVISSVLAPIASLVLGSAKKNRKSGKNASPNYRLALIWHNLFALLGIVAVLHVILATSTWSWPLRLFTLVWGGLTLSCYIWHKLIRPRYRTVMELNSVELYQDRTACLQFSQPLPGHQSGQFAYFSMNPPFPRTEEHPFTLSSPAGTNVEITVRTSGDYTSAMPTIPTGSTVSIDGPYGAFHPCKLPEGSSVVFLAGGIGITPALSMARDTNLCSRYPLTILWSLREPTELPAKDQLLQLEADGKLSLTLFHTRTAPEGQETSRISADTLRAIQSGQPEHTNMFWFLCGPRDFLRGMQTHLKSLGVPRRSIRTEKFSW